MGVIQVFTDLGSFKGVVCEKNKKRVIKTPVGLFISESKGLFTKGKKLLVVEMLAKRVTVLKILD